MPLNGPTRQQELLDYVDALTIDEARYVHGLLAQRLNAVSRLGEMVALQQYMVGERVAFHHNNRHIEGTVIRINLRTVSVVEDAGRRWTVSPQYLIKVTAGQPQAEPWRAPASNGTVALPPVDKRKNKQNAKKDRRTKTKKRRRR